MKLKNLIENILYEIKEKSLKIIYKTDILIQNFPEKEKEPEPVTKSPTETTPPEETTPEGQPQESTITEDIFKTSTKGELIVPEGQIDNIQGLEDLLDYISDQKEKGNSIINDLVIEIVMTLAAGGEKSIEDLITEGDRVIIDISYGKDNDNSVGLRVNKIAGSSAISLSMKKNNKILPGEFDLQEFNKQIIFIRNAELGG